MRSLALVPSARPLGRVSAYGSSVAQKTLRSQRTLSAMTPTIHALPARQQVAAAVGAEGIADTAASVDERLAAADAIDIVEWAAELADTGERPVVGDAAVASRAAVDI